MPVLAFDLGGTKLATALFSAQGELLAEEKVLLEKRSGEAIGGLIVSQVDKFIRQTKEDGIDAIGVSVPGISNTREGTVWAPNIAGWENYPLLKEIKSVSKDIPVRIESDRACHIYGESWMGAAKDCTDAIFIAVGTGIGAGIMAGGNVLHGANGIAGAIGWMALERPFQNKFTNCGCFESRASGDGIASLARDLLVNSNDYSGSLKNIPVETITAHNVFAAYEIQDPLAVEVMSTCIELWGMAVGNLVSIFNPQKIIFGGGVFGPAMQFIEAIRKEATRWAQPVSMKNVLIEPSALGGQAALYGAAAAAMKNN